MYCLVWLYIIMHDELEQIRPLLKFICVKAVVFLSFWQSVGTPGIHICSTFYSTDQKLTRICLATPQIVLLALVQFGALKPSDLAPDRDEGPPPTKAELAGTLNDVLICCEMFLAALAHANAFPAKEYYPPEPLTMSEQRGVMRNMWDMFNILDIFKDTTEFGGDMVALGGGALRDTTVAAVNIGVRGTRNVASNLPVLKNFPWSGTRHAQSSLACLAHQDWT